MFFFNFMFYFLFVILGADFLSMLILIVYVGAISILFLFVLMMLNIRLLEIYIDFFSYLPMGLFSDFGFFLVNSIVVWDFYISFLSYVFLIIFFLNNFLSFYNIFKN